MARPQGVARHAQPPPHLHLPSASAQEEACARRIITTLARHAYRRPVGDGDIAR
jgi:Fic family protein